GLVPFVGERGDLLLDEATHQLAEGIMFGGIERALHRTLASLTAILRFHHGRNVGGSLARSGWPGKPRRAGHGLATQRKTIFVPPGPTPDQKKTLCTKLRLAPRATPG